MKISPLTFFIIMLSIGLATLSFGFFQHWMPNQEESGFVREQIEKLEIEGGKLGKAKKRVEDTKKMVDEKAADWSRIASVHTPPADLRRGIDLNVNGWQLTVNARKFRNSAQVALNQQLKRGGVKVIAGPQIPFPPDSASTIVANYFNYPAIPFPVVIYELGAVTVQGTYRQITDHVRAWTTMPNYLAVADGLRIDGTSPVLTGTYNLTIVGYLQTQQVFPPVPEIGAGGQGAPGQQNTPSNNTPPQNTIRRKGGA